MVLVLAFLFGAILDRPNAERVAVITTAKGAVSARVTGNVWFSIERRMAKLVDRVQVIDASEQIIKLRGDSGALVEGCGGSINCLSGIGARLGVDRLITIEVEPHGTGYSCKLLVIEVLAHKATAELTFSPRASGEVDGKIDPQLKKIFATKLTSAEPAPPLALAQNAAPQPPRQTVDAPPPQLTPPALSPLDLSQTNRRPYKPTALGVTGIVTLVFSAATLGTAIGLGITSQNMRNTITDRTGQLSAVRTANDATLRSTLANAFYAASAAGFVAGGTCFTIDLWRERNR